MPIMEQGVEREIDYNRLPKKSEKLEQEEEKGNKRRQTNIW